MVSGFKTCLIILPTAQWALDSTRPWCPACCGPSRGVQGRLGPCAAGCLRTSALWRAGARPRQAPAAAAVPHAGSAGRPWSPSPDTMAAAGPETLATERARQGSAPPAMALRCGSAGEGPTPHPEFLRGAEARVTAYQHLMERLDGGAPQGHPPLQGAPRGPGPLTWAPAHCARACCAQAAARRTREICSPVGSQDPPCRPSYRRAATRARPQ